MYRSFKIVACNVLPPQISSYPEYKIEYTRPAPAPAPSRKLIYIAPSIHTSKDWDYSKFIENVTNNEIESVHITQDQHFVKILFKNSTEKELLLPEGYDIINFLIDNNVDIHIDSNHKPPIQLSVLDISLIILQCIFLSFVIKTILTNKKTDSIKPPPILDQYDQNIKMTAYRESGKLISQLLTNTIDSIESISIDPIFQIQSLPNIPDRVNLESRLKIILGGRVAEEIIFGALRSSSGKSSDIEIAIQLAYDIIATYGFSQSIGVTEWDTWNTPQLQEMIQNTANDIIKKTHKQIRKLIIKNRILLNSLAEELMEKRILYKDDIRAIILRVYKKTRKFNNKLIKHLNITDVEVTYKNGSGK